MCPATRFWQDRVHEITLRLYNQYGVKGVSIDQIAASAARLCFDPSHGHPLGGGHWWVTTGALLTAAWILPRENRLAIIIVNVGDKPIAASIAFNVKDYGLAAGRLGGTVLTLRGPTERFESASAFRRRVSLPPHEAQAWELTPAP
jgi:hypothetical protein